MTRRLIIAVCATTVACAHGQSANANDQNPKCRVPKLVERTEDSARRVLVAANLEVGNVQHLMSGNLVSQQRPSAGSIVRCRTSVHFVVGT